MFDEHMCPALGSAVANPDLPLDYNEKVRELTIRFLDDGLSGMQLAYCPFCGAALPTSLRDEWFDRLDELDMEPGDPAIPAPLQSGEWWRSAGL